MQLCGREPPQVVCITRQHAPKPRAQEPEMAPPLSWHSALVTQVPVSPVVAVHSALGNVTIWNKLQHAH